MSEVLTVHGWLLFASRILGLGAASAVLFDAVARAGSGPLALFRNRPRGALADFGLGLLLGWAVLGLLWLGLGLTGLYFSPVIAAAGFAALAGSRAAWRIRSPVAAAIAQARVMGYPGAAAGLACFALLAGLLCIPEFEMDCAYYHFGISWQWLQAHRALLYAVPFTNHVPLPFEMVHVLPVMLGDDRLAKWISLSFFLAAGAVWISVEEENGRGRTAWLGPLLALSGPLILWLVTSSKNDVPAGGWFVAGAVLWMRSASPLGACLMGFGLAAKYTAGPIAIVWLAAFPPARRRLLPTALLLGAAAAPWLVKAWLATGNPLYPLGARWFPSLSWTAANEVAFTDYASRLWDPRTGAVSTFPGALFASLRHDHLPVLLSLPALLLLGSSRRAAWAVMAGLVITLAAGHFARFLLPGLWLLAFLAAGGVAGLPPFWRRVVVPGAGVLALASIAFSYQLRWWDQGKAFRPLAPVLREFMTTRGEMSAILGGLPRSPGRTLRVLAAGEGRTYLFPARIVYGGVQGETPAVWAILKASSTVDDIRRRFRQAGTQYLLYNFVSSEWLGERYRDFPWDRRMVRLYVDYCLRHMVVASSPERSDYGNGGFYLFRLLPRPLARPQKWLFFLPGTESLYGPVTTLENMGRPADALSVSRALLAVIPEVGHAWNQVGHFLTVLGDMKGGFDALRPFVERGMLDGMNVGECGANAVRIRELSLGSRLLARTLRAQPDHRAVVFVNLAFLWVIQGVDALTVGNLRKAVSYSERAAWAIGQLPVAAGGAPVSPAQARARQETLSLVWALKGEIARLTGRTADAAEAFRAAWQTTPDMALSGRWKELAEAFSPRMFGTR